VARDEWVAAHDERVQDAFEHDDGSERHDGHRHRRECAQRQPLAVRRSDLPRCGRDGGRNDREECDGDAVVVSEGVYRVADAGTGNRGAHQHGDPRCRAQPGDEALVAGLAGDVERGKHEQPGGEHGVLHRIPAPEAAPPQLDICPVRAGQLPDREHDEADREPGSHSASPCRVITSGERDDPWADRRHEAGVQQWRVVQHRWVFEDRLQPATADRRDVETAERVGEHEYRQSERSHGSSTETSCSPGDDR